MQLTKFYRKKRLPTLIIKMVSSRKVSKSGAEIELVQDEQKERLNFIAMIMAFVLILNSCILMGALIYHEGIFKQVKNLNATSAKIEAKNISSK